MQQKVAETITQMDLTLPWLKLAEFFLPRPEGRAACGFRLTPAPCRVSARPTLGRRNRRGASVHPPPCVRL